MKDGKGMHASLVDWISATMILAVALLIIMYNILQNILLTLISVVIFMGLYIFVLILFKNRIRGKRIRKINEEIADEQVFKELNEFGEHSFITYIKELLERYYDIILIKDNKNIDFIGRIDGEAYGIKCYRRSPENKLALIDIQNYSEEMKNRGIEDGMLITNSYFEDEIREKENYILIDFDQIKRMLKETKKYPKKEDVEKIIIEKHMKGKGNIKERIKEHRKRKVLKFISLGLIFYIISPFVAYTLFYRVMALLSIIFGMVLGAYGIVNFLKE